MSPSVVLQPQRTSPAFDDADDADELVAVERVGVGRESDHVELAKAAVVRAAFAEATFTAADVQRILGTDTCAATEQRVAVEAALLSHMRAGLITKADAGTYRLR